MPIKTEVPPLLHFEPVAPSKLDVPYADLQVVDMSTYDSGPAAQALLAEQIRFAMHTQGFFILSGIPSVSEEEITRQVDIGYTVLQSTPIEEKKRLESETETTGLYRGFKLRRYYEMEDGVKDQIEQFNWQRDMATQEFPSTIQPFLPEVESFCERVHKKVLFDLFRLFALSLKLPSETFVDMHKFEEVDDSYFRYMAYYDEHTSEDEAKIKGVWLKGHQDHGSVTMVFSQPMASLQVRAEDGTWSYVKHVPGGIIINCGIMMEWWTGGYFKAANHRVSAPPDDQRGHTRCGVFYFSIPNDDVRPLLLKESPVLREAGVQCVFKDGKGIDSKTFSRARVAKVGKSAVYKQAWGAGERLVENIAGVEVPHFG